MNKKQSPGQIAWRNLWHNRIARVALLFLFGAYFIALFAGFFTPYSPTNDEFRDRFFHPPTRLHFFDANGSFHFRPFIRTTFLLDRERLIYSSATPLYLLYRQPATNWNPRLPDTIESPAPVITVLNEKGEILGSCSMLYETDVDTGLFKATIALDPSRLRKSNVLLARTISGETLNLKSAAPSNDLLLIDEHGNSLKSFQSQNRSIPVRFLVRGHPYRILGLFPSRLHLFGVDPPAHIFLFGTDQSGRDIFSRALYGAQISLSIGLVGVLITTILGLFFGGIAGYYGGITDHILMRFAEILMSMPALYLILTLRNLIPDRVQDSYDRLAELNAQTFAWQTNPASMFIVIAAFLLLLAYYSYRKNWQKRSLLLSLVILLIVIFGSFFVDLMIKAASLVIPGKTHLSSGWTYLLIIMILSTVGWAAVARVIRGMVLSLREAEFVLSAKSSGASDFRILTHHILPNTFGYVIVRATLLIPAYILGEVALSYLGVGVQEPTPSWGNMLAACQNLQVLEQFSWSLSPGILLFLVVLAYNFLGDALRDALDPRQIR